MKVTCPRCAANFNVDASKIPSKGARLRCAKCRELFPVMPMASEALPLPDVDAPDGWTHSPAPQGETPPSIDALDPVPLPAPEGEAAFDDQRAPIAFDGGSSDLDEADLPGTAPRRTLVPPAPRDDGPLLDDAQAGMIDETAFEALFETSEGEDEGEEPDPVAIALPEPGDSPIPLPAGAVDIEAAPSDPEDLAEGEELFDPFAPTKSASEAISLPAPGDDAIPLPDEAGDVVPLPAGSLAPIGDVPPEPSTAAVAAPTIPLPSPSDDVPATAVPLPGETLDEDALFGPGPSSLAEASGGRPLDLDETSSMLSAADEPFSFDEDPDDADVEVVAETEKTATGPGAHLPEAQAPLTRKSAEEPGVTPAPRDAEETSAEEDEDVAEAFLKSLSGTVMRGAADALDGLDQDLNGVSSAQSDGPESGSDVARDDPLCFERAAPLDVPALELDLPPATPNLDAAEEEMVAATPGLEKAKERLDADALFGAERAQATAEPPAPVDFASMLTFNSAHEVSDDAVSGARASPPPGDLELDLPAAADRASPQDDKLEVLDFIEEKGGAQAPSAPTLEGSSYYLRRQSEKPRGPFDTLTIIYMITSGQLLGDEEVSRDQDSWAPINSVRAFAEAIEQLMASPGDVTFAVDNVAENLAHQKDEELERIKARYGDRIADIAIVSSPERQPKFRLSRPAAAGIAALLILLAGASLGLTSYGPFAIHWLFPKEIKAGTPEHRSHLQALEALRLGTWAGDRQALAIAETLLTRDPSLIEPRALYAESAFHLQRVYRTDADKRGKAERYLRDLSADDEKAARPDLLKALIASDLLQKNTSRRAALEAHLGAHPEDRAATYLLSDLLAVAGDTPGAVRLLEGLLAENAGDVRALRQIGLIRLGEQTPEEAWVEAAIEVTAEATTPSESSPREEATAAEPGARPIPASAQQGMEPGQAASAIEPPTDPDAAGADGEEGPRPRVVKVNPRVLEALTFFDRAIEANPEDVESILAKADVLTRLIPRPREALALFARLEADGLAARLSPPDRSRASFLRGLDHVALRQYGEAFVAFDEALETGPEDAEIPALYGKLRLNRGEYEEAETLFARARAAEPDNLLHLDGQVRALLGLEKYHQAQTLLAEARGENQENTRLALLQGRVFDELDKEAEAIASYQKALADDEVGWEAAFYLGNIYLERGRLDEAKKAFDQALAQGARASLPHVGQGRYFLASGELAEAFDAFDNAIRIDGENAEAHFGMAEVLAAQGQLTEAEKAFARAIAINEKLPGLETRYGALLWRLGKREEAAAAFEKARALDFRDVEALWKQGAVYFELKRYEQALESLSSALAAEPGHVDALFYKARVQYERQETPQAIQTIRSALERKKDRAGLYYWAGKIYSQAQKFSEAVAAWSEAIQLDPNYAEAIESLAHAYQDQGDFAHAVTFFEKTLTADPKRQALHFNIAECLFSMNRYKEAIAEYQAVIGHDPNFKEAYFKTGRSYNEMNQLDQAIKWYDKAIQLDKNYAEAWMLLGYAHKEKFRYRRAIAAFEQYLKNATNKKDIETIQTEILDLKSLL